MADSWVVAINSRDRIAGASSNVYTAAIPSDLPKRPYKCTVRFVIGSLAAAQAYAVMFKSPAITRFLSSASSGSYSMVCTFGGGQQAEPGVVYFSTAPDRIDIAILAISTQVLPAVDEHIILLHFEPTDSC